MKTPSPSRAPFRWGRVLLTLLLFTPIPLPSAAPHSRSADRSDLRAAERGPTVMRARFLMGTLFTFEAPAGEDPLKTAKALEAGLDEVDRLEGILSNWREESEISRLNRSAPGERVGVSSDLFRVIAASLHWAAETEGAFDPTVETITRAFRASDSATLPTGSPRKPKPVLGGWRRVRLDPTSRAVRFKRGIQGVDSGGIGKGYALDRAGQVLIQQGVSAALLDAGGQVLALGAAPGELGWSVAIADPSDRMRPALRLCLRDVSAATSGNSERPGEIIDPATGAPVEGVSSSTAIAPDATAADALSTALFVMGRQRGIEWAARREDLLAIFVEPAPAPGEHLLVASAVDPEGEGGVPWVVSSQVSRGGRTLIVRHRSR